MVNGYGDGTIFLLPRGSEGRTPTFWNLDFHADYKLPFFGRANARSLSVILDVFNVFNKHETLEVDQDYIYEGQDRTFDLWVTVPSNLDAYGNPNNAPAEARLQHADPVPDAAVGPVRSEVHVLSDNLMLLLKGAISIAPFSFSAYDRRLAGTPCSDWEARR